MKKTVNSSSKLKPTNFVRRVLSRSTTSHSKTSLDADESEKLMEKSSVNLETELLLLKGQVENLQLTLHSKQYDADNNERAMASLAMANLAKEKEQLAIDLKKQKRSNLNLKQQLEDERNFYYKEKEQYCNEMNSYKKLKQKSEHRVQDSCSRGDVAENNYKKETAMLKNSLNQALEANYNLSVKFLRMKNTKLSLKHQLNKIRHLHENAMESYKTKLEEIQTQLNELANEQFVKPIPPSNKKYLQIMKHNGALIHENLCLQLEVDRINLELENMKMLEIRTDTNSKLKFIHNANKGPSKCPKCKTMKSKWANELESIRTSTTNTSETNTKLTVHNETSTVSCNDSEKFEMKIYEKESEEDVSLIKDKETEVEIISKSSKYELMNVSNSNLSNNNDSAISYYTNTAYRTQSAPEIVQNVNSLT